jgi:putative endonuclease
MALFSSQKFNNQSLASRGEAAARHDYERRGCRILARNLINIRGKRIGEIDFIALRNESIHFVEVKTRSSPVDRFGGARYSVPLSKQKKLLKIVKLFLLKYPPYRSLRPQIDICLVWAETLDKGRFSVIIIPHAVDDLSR